jgi:NADPH:quinone reductase-like Zn-dependent oxidoreductase
MLRRLLRWAVYAVALVLVFALGALVVAYFRSTNACDDRNAAAPGHPMKAIIYCDYGDADVLQVKEVEKPAPKDDEVLVKVRAVAVNPLDWHFIRGTPLLMRVGSGLRKPKVIRIGVDFAGVVEAAGKSVTRFKPGDEVFGGKTGAFAEYVSVREEGALTPKPAGLTFEQAASLPIAAETALQGVRDAAKVQPGVKVLVNGASGGVGTYAVQLAKHFGGEVTAVCSGRNAEMVRSLGADHVIDYTKEDFTKGSERYDAIVDNVGNHSFPECRRVLAKTGRYVLIGGGGPNDHPWIGPLGSVIAGKLTSLFVPQQMSMMLADLNSKDLAFLADLMQAGKIKAVIDRQYSFNELPEAIRYLEAGHARGKVVVTVP